MKKLSYDYVKQYFKDQGCELLSTEYVNVHNLLDYVCSCGNKSKISFHNYKHGTKSESKCEKCKKSKKLLFEDVKQYFKDQRCELLSTEYTNNSTLMDYVCNCGNKSKISLNNFKSGYRCSKCGGSERLKYDYVKQYFKDQGCELLSTEYTNNSTLLNYICNCGNKSKINFHNYKNGNRCKQCGNKKAQDSQKTSFEDVKQYFEDQGCELLSTEYTNAHNLLDYICSCGNKSIINFNSFKNGRRCKQCGIKKIKTVLKTPFEEVKQYFKDQRCELLSTEYINNHTSISYICSCGNKSETNFCDFKQGRRCDKCKPRSKGEVKIYKLFDLKEITYNMEVVIKEIGNKRYDFQVNNSFIEYHGRQHYCPYSFGSKEKHADSKNLLKCIERDQIKIDYCKNNQISLLIIPFWEFSRIESIIEKFLNGEKIEIYDPPKIVLKYDKLRQRMRDHLKIESNEFLGGVI